MAIRLCEARFSSAHHVTIGVEYGSRILPVGPPASNDFQFKFGNHINESPSHKCPTSMSSATGLGGDQTASGLPNPPQKSQESHHQKRMKLSLWDTAGQETYKSITRSYFRGASGALLVFDITRPSTFTSCTQWLHDLRQIAEDGIVIVLVGNKSDLAGDGSELKHGRVTKQEAEEWCHLNNVVHYVETSAKSGEGVERAFLEVAESIYRNIEAGKYDLGDRRSGVKKFRATDSSRSDATKTVALGLNGKVHEGGNGFPGGCC